MDKELQDVADRLWRYQMISEGKLKVQHTREDEVNGRTSCAHMEYRYYGEEQRMLRDQAREGLADAFELDYYDDGCEYEDFDYREY